MTTPQKMRRPLPRPTGHLAPYRPPRVEGGAPAGDRGSATLAIGDESWEFASFSCAFGHDATRSDTFSFSSDARGEHSTGARVQMQANITDGDGRYEGAGVDYEVYIADIQDFTNPAVKWSSPSDFRLAPRETVIRIDGDNLTAEGNFDDGLTEGVFEAVPGTLTAACGRQSIR